MMLGRRDQRGEGKMVVVTPHNENPITETIKGAFRGATIGVFLGILRPDNASSIFPPSYACSAVGGAMMGTHAGISCAMKRIRGKEDVQNRFAAGFGSGVIWSLLVNGMGGANQAVSTGVLCALVSGGFFKIGQKFKSQPSPEYNEARCMLSTLGLQNYENNFKKGLLTDRTIPLLTDGALRDVKIPPGPRLLILDYIRSDLEQSDLERKKKRWIIF